MEIELKAISIRIIFIFSGILDSLSLFFAVCPHALRNMCECVCVCNSWWPVNFIGDNYHTARDKERVSIDGFYRSFYGGQTPPYKSQMQTWKWKPAKNDSFKTMNVRVCVCVWIYCWCCFCCQLLMLLNGHCCCCCCWLPGHCCCLCVDYKSILFCFPTTKIHITIYCVTQTMLGVRADERV